MLAKGAYELAKSRFDARRKELVESGAWWAEPSVVARLRQRMEARAMRVAKLHAAWEAAEDAELLVPYTEQIAVQQRMIDKQETIIETQQTMIAALQGRLLQEKQAAHREKISLLKELISVRREMASVHGELSECHGEKAKAAQKAWEWDLYLKGYL